MLENGWKITLPSQQHDLYLCHCENTMKVRINESTEYPQITCPQCGNDLFLSLDRFLDITQHLYIDHFNYTTRTFIDRSGWHAVIAFHFPQYDTETQKISYSLLDLLDTALLFDGSIKQKILNKDIGKKAVLKGLVASNLGTYLKEKNNDTLAYFVRHNLPSRLTWLPDKEKEDISIQLVSYCLKNPSVEEIDLFYWNDQHLQEINNFKTAFDALHYLLNGRKEKSVKKALFTHYQLQMNRPSKFYDPTFDYVVLRVFDDPNYLTFLLSLPVYYKNNMFTGMSPYPIIESIEFLRRYYSQNEFFTLMKQALKIKEVYHLWNDCFRMLSVQRNLPVFKEHFERPRPQVTLIHDELVRIQNLYINLNKVEMLQPFVYPKHQLKAETSFNGLSFRLPQTAKELHIWGKELHNCMFSYASHIHDQQTVIYGVFKERKLTYAVEIRNNRIIQAKAVNNKRLSDVERDLINAWHKKLF